MNLWFIFLTGLTTGGLSCLAMQGGLLASVITNQKNLNQKNSSSGKILSQDDWLPVALFLVSKLISHMVLGFLLGLLGSVISLSTQVRVLFQIFTAIFMFATAMNLLNVHPAFRYLAIQPPKFIQKRIKRLLKNDTFFAPAFLGICTIFIPCGVTQAMEVLAINSGNPLKGALIMFAFVLGTSPLFSLLGIATSRLGDLWQEKFMKVAAAGLIVMSLIAINGVLVVTNAPISYQRVIATIFPPATKDLCQITSSPECPPINSEGSQKVTINIENHGYSPNRIQVVAGQPVELSLVNSGVYTCASAFVFPQFNIDSFIKPGTSESFNFTPIKKGTYTFSCSMGMYTGVLEVI